ncbi:MAG: hypothetical protein ACK559_23225, partial [bacterium]
DRHGRGFGEYLPCQRGRDRNPRRARRHARDHGRGGPAEHHAAHRDGDADAEPARGLGKPICGRAHPQAHGPTCRGVLKQGPAVPRRDGRPLAVAPWAGPILPA